MFYSFETTHCKTRSYKGMRTMNVAGVGRLSHFRGERLKRLSPADSARCSIYTLLASQLVSAKHPMNTSWIELIGTKSKSQKTDMVFIHYVKLQRSTFWNDNKKSFIYNSSRIKQACCLDKYHIVERQILVICSSRRRPPSCKQQIWLSSMSSHVLELISDLYLCTGLQQVHPKTKIGVTFYTPD